MKLDKKLYETHAKRLHAIINAGSTFAPHLTRPEFNTLLKLELNTLAEVEKKFAEDKLDKEFTAETLTKKFIELTKVDFKLGDKFKFEDDDDLIDNINYLPTYCNNIFKVKLDDLVAGKKVVAENPNIDLGHGSAKDAEDGMDAAAAFNIGAMGYATSPYENPFLMGKAYGKLNKDILEGKVYQYKTKPNAVVICKWLLLILIGLSVISLIITSIFSFMAYALPVRLNGVSENPDRNLNTITNGIFYLICAGFGVYTFYSTLKSLLKKNGKVNENALYQFNWYFYLAFILLTLLITLLDLRTTWFYQNSFTITDTSSTRYLGFVCWKYGIVVTAGLTGAALVPMIVGAVNTPKIDRERMEGILKQYLDEVSPKGPVSGPEVQKPVDVKPSNDGKKDEELKS